MSFKEKRRAAEAVLEAAGIKRSYYAPPLYRLMWVLGLNVPPPHFAGYVANALLTSVWFIIAVGVIRLGMEVLMAALGGTTIAWQTVLHWWIVFLPVGVLFGPIFALYFAWSARKHRLPAWKDLD